MKAKTPYIIEVLTVPRLHNIKQYKGEKPPVLGPQDPLPPLPHCPPVHGIGPMPVGAGLRVLPVEFLSPADEQAMLVEIKRTTKYDWQRTVAFAKRNGVRL